MIYELPQSGDELRRLLEDLQKRSFLTPATHESAGTMSAEDKVKLDGLPADTDARLTDAATAAATAQSTADNAATAATKAQETANTATQAAEAAQGLASLASTSAANNIDYIDEKLQGYVTNDAAQLMAQDFTQQLDQVTEFVGSMETGMETLGANVLRNTNNIATAQTSADNAATAAAAVQTDLNSWRDTVRQTACLPESISQSRGSTSLTYTIIGADGSKQLSFAIGTPNNWVGGIMSNTDWIRLGALHEWMRNIEGQAFGAWPPYAPSNGGETAKWLKTAKADIPDLKARITTLEEAAADYSTFKTTVSDKLTQGETAIGECSLGLQMINAQVNTLSQKLQDLENRIAQIEATNNS